MVIVYAIMIGNAIPSSKYIITGSPRTIDDVALCLPRTFQNLSQLESRTQNDGVAARSLGPSLHWSREERGCIQNQANSRRCR